MLTAATLPRVSVNKPELFRRIGYKPHPVQLEIHTSESKRRVVAAGVRMGKSRAAAMESLAAALTPGKHNVGWVVAPTYTLSEKVFREIWHAVHDHFPDLVLKASESEQWIRMSNLGGGITEIWGRSADNPTSLLGEGLDFLIVDEASRIKPNVWDGYLSQRLIDRDGWALLISTPKGKNWFYREWMRGYNHEHGYESWQQPSWSNPHLKRELIEAQRSLIPEGLWNQEYAAQFMEGAGSVFRNVEEAATGDMEDPSGSCEYWAGLDLAKVEDYTVLTVLRKPVQEYREIRAKGTLIRTELVDDPIGKTKVVFVDRFNRVDWPIQMGRIRAGLERYGNPVVWVDSTGVGDPIADAMVEHGLRPMPYKFTAQSKAALINGLALILEKQRLIIPRRDIFPRMAEELEAFEYSVTDAGNVRSGSPPGFHDDCVISLALAAWPVHSGQGSLFSRSL